MKRFSPLALLLVALLIVTLEKASAGNLLTNGSFQSRDFTGWNQGTTPNGSPGLGFPIVATWPLGGVNAAEYNVGEVNYTTLQEGATLSQTFTTTAGLLNLGFGFAALDNSCCANSDGGLFTLVVDGVGLAAYNVGLINPNQLITGSVSALTITTAGEHTFDIDITRPWLTSGITPFQFVSGAYANQTSEPASMLLLGSGFMVVARRLRKRA